MLRFVRILLYNDVELTQREMAVGRDDDREVFVADEVLGQARLGSDDGGDGDAAAREQLCQRLAPAASSRTQDDNLWINSNFSSKVKAWLHESVIAQFS